MCNAIEQIQSNYNEVLVVFVIQLNIHTAISVDL